MNTLRRRSPRPRAPSPRHKVPDSDAGRPRSRCHSKGNDEILGFTAFGFWASELMAAVQTAMVGRMPYTVLRDTIFTHPTMSEGLVFLLSHRLNERRHRVDSRQRILMR
jgi:pyruvate/2-oxoglutarate dehydrogenase complex dihydrolipoamide dehydrogenase (E3) component